MKYLVRARVKPGRDEALLKAVDEAKLGKGSVAEGEYLRNMGEARVIAGSVRWVEVCYCPTPLAEERPYWEEYFELTRVQDARPAPVPRPERYRAVGLRGVRLH